MIFTVTILGSSSAVPTSKRALSAQIVQYENQLFLIDCGEGTQMQMRKYDIKSARINHIFISHLHGDHYLGLMGLLSTLHMMGRKTDLHIYCPPELEEIIESQKKIAGTLFSYQVFFHHLNNENEGVIFKGDKLEVSSVMLHHRIPTFGFIFKEKDKEKKIYKEAIIAYGLDFKDIVNIKKGEKYIDKNGHVVPTEMLTYPEVPSKTYAYISDTAYYEEIIKKIKNVDLLYHEATFAEEMKKTAAEKFHSTALEAATIAKKANAKNLLIGHFSARYKTPDVLISEAQSVFANTESAEDGSVYNV